LNVLKQNIQVLEKEYKSLVLARDVLREVIKENRDRILPNLMSYASEVLAKLTQKKYLTFSLKEDMASLSVFIKDIGKVIAIDNLSSSTFDLMIFVFRLGLLNFYSNYGNVKLPLFLDDFFVHFDDERLTLVLFLLEEISKKHQVFLCTCCKREKELMDKLSISYNLVNL